jgi:3-dehydroquinate dehydratase/shikimate dehydrogenase
MICVSIRARTNDEAVRLLHRAKAEGAQIAEIRADYLESPDLPKILAAKPLPVIVTVRPAWEGGAWKGDEAQRVMLLEEAGKSGADYLDLEFKAYKDLPDVESKRIVSYHDFERVPENLAATVRKMEQLKPFLVKVACQAKSTRDLLELAKLARGSTLRSSIAMGEFGEPLRVLYGKLGSYLTYAALDAESATAPGQLTLKELVELYAADKIDEDWKVYAVIGNPVRQSRGPILWNRAFRKLGWNSVYVRVPVDEVGLLREVVETFDLSGLSVTVPHKQAVMDQLDEVDEVADRIGAVNTVVRREGRLIGYNTDWVGAMGAIQEGCERAFGGDSLSGKKCLLVGAGGTSRAILYGLMRAGADVIVTNRDWDKASDLAQEFGARPIPIEAIEQVVDPDVIVNATSVGMAPRENESLVPRAMLGAGQVCFDAVYTPRMTRFLRDAEAAGATAVSGGRMFVLQAAEQFRLFTGEELPGEILTEWETQ